MSSKRTPSQDPASASNQSRESGTTPPTEKTGSGTEAGSTSQVEPRAAGDRTTASAPGSQEEAAAIPVSSPATEHPAERRSRARGKAMAALAARDGVDAAEALRRAVADHPALFRPQLDAAWTLLAAAEESGIAPDLDAADRQLAAAAWNTANLLVALAAKLEAGAGSEERQTPGGRPTGSVRVWAAEIVGAVQALDVYRRAVTRTGDELVVVLEPRLRELFEEAARLAPKAPSERIAAAFAEDLTAAVTDVGVYLDDALAARIRSDVLGGRTLPAEAAIAATVLVLARDHGVTEEAVRGGAAERIRQEIGDRPLRLYGESGEAQGVPRLHELAEEIEAEAGRTEADS